MVISLEFPSSAPGYLLRDIFCSGLGNMSEAQRDPRIICAGVLSNWRWHQEPGGCEEKFEEWGSDPSLELFPPGVASAAKSGTCLPSPQRS